MDVFDREGGKATCLHALPPLSRASLPYPVRNRAGWVAGDATLLSPRASLPSHRFPQQHCTRDRSKVPQRVKLRPCSPLIPST